MTPSRLSIDVQQSPAASTTQPDARRLTPVSIYCEEHKEAMKKRFPNKPETFIACQLQEEWKELSETKKMQYRKKQKQMMRELHGPSSWEMNKWTYGEDWNQHKAPESAFGIWASATIKKLAKQNSHLDFAAAQEGLRETWEKMSTEEKRPYQEQCKKLYDAKKKARTDSTVFHSPLSVSSVDTIQVKYGFESIVPTFQARKGFPWEKACKDLGINFADMIF